MRIIRICTAALARFLISAIFLAGAIHKILNWSDAEKNLMNVLCDWQFQVGFSDQAQDCFAALVPWTPLLLVIATLFELVGGLLLLLGVREKLGATLLVLFLIPATILFHSFWFLDGPARELQIVMVMKNLAILGGLFLVLLHGAEGESGGGSDFSGMKFG